MSTTDYTIELGSLLMGPGTDYIITKWEGYGISSFRTSDDPAPLQHGTWTGPEYLPGRDVTIDVLVRGDSAEDVVTSLEALLAAWYLDTTVDGYGTKLPLQVKIPGLDERYLYGRPRRAKVATDRIVGANAQVSLEFFGSDPRWYSATLHTETINGGSAATGYGYAKAYDYGYGGGAGNLVVATNAGSFPTTPSVTIYGPVTNPYIENTTTGETVYFDITLGVGETLVVDFTDKTVLLGGTTSRYNTKRGTWWALVPGNNSIRLGGTSAGTPTASVSWRDAWV
jgi:hypothetical protein